MEKPIGASDFEAEELVLHKGLLEKELEVSI